MSNKKRFASSVLIAASMLIGLAGCASTADTKPVETPPVSEPIAQTSDIPRSETAHTAVYPGKIRLVWYVDSPINQPSRVLVEDKEFLIEPGIKPPSVNSVFLLEHSEVREGEDVLDMGTGSGLHAVFAAEKAHRVVATDIDPHAVDVARKNATKNGVVDKIDFRVGDLFAPIREGEKFDVFFWNILYPFSDADQDRWKLHERFFADVRQYMKPNARIYYQLGFLRNIPYVVDMLDRNGLSIERMEMVNARHVGREPIMMMIQLK